jgi:hypothetical protein
MVRAWRHRRIEALPSRKFLNAVLAPALAAAGHRRMLFVGAQPYNLPFYAQCEALGIDVWSVDFDPASARYGAPGGHFVGDIRNIHALVGAMTFDIIMFNGILGFGINSAPDAVAAVEAMARIAQPNTLLVVGWNPGRTNDDEMAAIRLLLSPTALETVPEVTIFPARGRAQRNPHLYEIFRFRM